MNRISKLSVTAVLSFAVVLFGAVPAMADTATVRILNQTSWDIHHFFLSPTDVNDWGPDQLDEQVLESGSSFTLTDIDCDLWDVRLVDEDGDECIVVGVALCDEDAVWTISDDDLLECEGWE
jgi:hypothetical protein